MSHLNDYQKFSSVSITPFPFQDPTPITTKSKLDKPNLFGLENNRYYCYLNAVLQCLFNIREFV